LRENRGMKHKAAELQGGLLDLAVAKAEGRRTAAHPSEPGWWMVLNNQREWETIMDEEPDEVDPKVWSPSAKWEHGGPIMERERIALRPGLRDPEWFARGETPKGALPCDWRGPTPLVAAMRAHVAKRLGVEVDLP